MIAKLGRCSWMIAWIALAACGGAARPPGEPGSPPAAAEATCAQAVAGLFAVAATDEPPELRARSAKVFEARCDADRWPAEVRSCMAAIRQLDDADRCEAMLTPEQRRELADALARELDAAGVAPQVESGKPRAPATKGARGGGDDPCDGGE